MVKIHTIQRTTNEEEWFSTVLPSIAELIELNWDSDTHTMYLGTDKTTGISFELDTSYSNHYIKGKGMMNGVLVNLGSTSNYLSFQTNITNYFFYSKTTDGYAFNSSTAENAETLNFGYCLATLIENNESIPCYYGFGESPKATFTSRGYYNMSVPYPQSNEQCAALYNYVTSNGLYYCNYLFLPVFFPAITVHIKFNLNGKLFSSQSCTSTSAPRLIVPLDESNW